MPLIFLLFPLLELWTLIALGTEIGAFGAILYVLGTIVAGVMLLQRQGLAMARKMQQQYGGRMFGVQLLQDDMAIVGSGLLLIVPGMITDILALVCLVGPLRRRLLGLVGAPTQPGPGPAQGGPVDPRQGDTLEGEFRRLDD